MNNMALHSVGCDYAGCTQRSEDASLFVRMWPAGGQELQGTRVPAKWLVLLDDAGEARHFCSQACLLAHMRWHAER